MYDGVFGEGLVEEFVEDGEARHVVDLVEVNVGVVCCCTDGDGEGCLVTGTAMPIYGRDDGAGQFKVASGAG